MIRKTLVRLFAFSLMGFVALGAWKQLRQRGVSTANELKMALFSETLSQEFLPKKPQESADYFDKYVFERTKGDLAAEEKLLRDDASMLPLCHGDQPHACAAMVVTRGRELKKLEAKIAAAPEGEPKTLLLDEKGRLRAEIAAIAADACILGAPLPCRFAFPHFAKRVMKALVKYCDHGLGEYCTEAGFQFKSDENYKDATEMFVAGCRHEITNGLIETGDACAEILNGGLLPADDTRVVAARKAFSVLCETEHEESRKLSSPPCQVLSRFYNRNHDPVQALEYADRSCALGNADSCMLKAEIVLANHAKDRYKVAHEVRRFCVVQKGLSGKDAETCRLLTGARGLDDELWMRILEIQYGGKVRRGIAIPGHRLADRVPASI